MAVLIGIWLIGKIYAETNRRMELELEKGVERIEDLEKIPGVERYTTKLIKDKSGNIVGITFLEEENKREKLGE